MCVCVNCEDSAVVESQIGGQAKVGGNDVAGGWLVHACVDELATALVTQACVGPPKRLARLLANPTSVGQPLTEHCEDKHEFSTQGLGKRILRDDGAAVLGL